MTKKNPRVLVGVTTYEAKDYIFDRCMQSIAAFDYDNFDVMVVDNSKSFDYFLKLKRRGYQNVFHVDRGKNSREALTKSQNYIRAKMLEGGYDYLLFVESDLLPPPDTIIRLMGYGKPVVGSTYMIGTGDYQVPCIFLDDIRKEGFKATRPLGIKVEDDGRKLRNPREIEMFLNTGGPIKQAHGVGFGCTLIKREIIEKYGFWCDERFDDKHSDVYFYLDLSRDRVPVFVDITGVVPHFPSDWGKVADR